MVIHFWTSGLLSSPDSKAWAIASSHLSWSCVAWTFYILLHGYCNRTLGVDSKIFKSSWGPGEGQRAKTMQISNILFSRWRRMVKLYSVYLIRSRIKVSMAVPRVAPIGLWALCKKLTVIIFFSKLVQSMARNQIPGDFIGIHSGTCCHHGGPVNAQAKTLRISPFLVQIPKASTSSCIKCTNYTFLRVKNKALLVALPRVAPMAPCGVTGWGGGPM